MDSAQQLAPTFAIALSIVTFLAGLYRTRKMDERTQRLDDRAAAKETVDLLVTQNKALSRDLSDVRRRMAEMERKHSDCETARTMLLARLRKYETAAEDMHTTIHEVDPGGK